MYRYTFRLFLLKVHFPRSSCSEPDNVAGTATACTAQNGENANKIQFLEIGGESRMQEEKLSASFRICMINVLITAVKSLRYP